MHGGEGRDGMGRKAYARRESLKLKVLRSHKKDRETAMTPTNEPCLMSERDALTTPAICGLSASATFSSAPSRALTT